MSKSLGNSLLLEDLLKQYSNEAIKFALLQTNYKNDVNLTSTVFEDAEKHLAEFYEVFVSAKKAGIVIEGEDKEIDEEFDSAMTDDFNTALALSNLYKYFKVIKQKIAKNDSSAGALLSQIKTTYSLLGLFKKDAEEFIAYVKQKNANAIPEEVVSLAEERKLARQTKDWAKSDELRDKIAELGFIIKDSKDGYEIIKK